VLWKVRKVAPDHPALGGDSCGTYDLHTQTIYIDRNMSRALQWATLWHELLHIIGLGHDHLDVCTESGVEVVSGEVYAITVYLDKEA
jgi:Zn-dependent peptidase ImmA (M78 family)